MEEWLTKFANWKKTEFSGPSGITSQKAKEPQQRLIIVVMSFSVSV
jgi:glycine cleavage system aminomethyltransferase T